MSQLNGLLKGRDEGKTSAMGRGSIPKKFHVLTTACPKNSTSFGTVKPHRLVNRRAAKCLVVSVDSSSDHDDGFQSKVMTWTWNLTYIAKRMEAIVTYKKANARWLNPEQTVYQLLQCTVTIRRRLKLQPRVRALHHSTLTPVQVIAPASL